MRPRVVLLVAVVLGGCLWRSYDRIMSVHLDVLAGMVDKMVSSAGSGRRPSPNDMTEMLYPLQRARQFVHQFERYRERESYRQFVALLGRYETLATAIDDARTDEQRWAQFQERLPALATALQTSVGEVRAALQRGT